MHRLREPTSRRAAANKHIQQDINGGPERENEGGEGKVDPDSTFPAAQTQRYMATSMWTREHCSHLRSRGITFQNQSAATYGEFKRCESFRSQECKARFICVGTEGEYCNLYFIFLPKYKVVGHMKQSLRYSLATQVVEVRHVQDMLKAEGFNASVLIAGSYSLVFHRRELLLESVSECKAAAV